MIDTTDILLEDFSPELQERLAPLIEQLAERVHLQWMRNRLSEGWTYGESRDDMQKTHPSLIPYEQLSDAEKHYDRATALETISFLLQNGFQISPTPSP